jgi:hypothetical protein
MEGEQASMGIDTFLMAEALFFFPPDRNCAGFWGEIAGNIETPLLEW